VAGFTENACVSMRVFILVTYREKGYIVFVEKYVTGNRITSPVDLTISVCPYENTFSSFNQKILIYSYEGCYTYL